MTLLDQYTELERNALTQWALFPKKKQHLQTLHEVMDQEDNPPLSYVKSFTNDRNNIHPLSINEDGAIIGVDESFILINPITFEDLGLKSKLLFLEMLN